MGLDQPLSSAPGMRSHDTAEDATIVCASAGSSRLGMQKTEQGWLFKVGFL